MSRRARKAGGQSPAGRGSTDETLARRSAEATEEVARAESALQYRKAQLAEAEEERAGLDGMGGMFLAMLGRRASAQAEADARIKALQSEILACRARLIGARQVRATLDREEQARADARAARDVELEHFAERVRESEHALRDALVEVETEIQAGYDELADLTEAFRACSGLSSSLGQVGRTAERAQRMAAVDLYVDLPGLQAMQFLKTREIQREAETIPDAMARFDAACGKLGLEPIAVQLPHLSQDWVSVVFDTVLTDLMRIRRLADYHDEIRSVRELAVETSMWVAERRTVALRAQEDRIQRRRTLLDEALG